MRGRPPKPSHLKLIAGNPGHRPINKREPQPTCEGRPEPPPHLIDEALVEWNRVIDELHASRMITKIDSGALAVMCQDYATHVQATKAIQAIAEKQPVTKGLVMQGANGGWVTNPLVGIARRAAAGYLRAAAEFGMTPSARSRIIAEKGGEADPTAKFFA